MAFGGERSAAPSGGPGTARTGGGRTVVAERPARGAAVADVRVAADDLGQPGGPPVRRGFWGGERFQLTPASLLRIYVCVLTLVPSTQVFAPLGAVGTPANVLAMGGLVWYMISWILGRVRPAPGGRPARMAVFILSLAVLASFINAMLRTINAEEISGAQRGLLMLVAWTGTVTLATRGVTKRAELLRLVNVFVICGSIMATLGVTQFYTGFDLVKLVHIPGLKATVDISTIMVRDGFNRPAATTAHPIEFGVIMAMCLPFALFRALEMKEKGRFSRWYPVAMIAMVLPLSVSRSGIIGLFIAVIVMWVRWSAQRRISSLILGVAGMGVVGLVAHGLISSLIHLFSTFFSNSDSSTQARTNDYAAAFHYISIHPIFGRGFQTFTPDIYRYMDNTYLLDTIELGVVGIVALFVVFLLGMHCGAAGRRRTRDPQLRELGQAFVASVAVAMVTSATFDSMTFAMFTGVLFLVIGLGGAYLGITTAEQKRRQAAAVAEQERWLVESEPRAEADFAVGAEELPPEPDDEPPWRDNEADGPSAPPSPSGDRAGEAAGAPAKPRSNAWDDTTAVWAVGLLGRNAQYTADDTLPMFIGGYGGYDRQRNPVGYGGERHVFDDGIAYGGGTVELPRVVLPEEAPPEADGDGGLGRKLRTGALFSLVNTILMRAGNFLTTIYIVRLFSHTEWGIYAAGTTALQLLLSMNEAGVSLAVIRWEGDVRKFAPTVATLSALSSTIIYVLLYFSAPWVASGLGVPGAAGTLRLLCLCVVIDGFAAVPLAVLAREFLQGKRLIVDLANFVISTGITLALATQGWGANSLAWGAVIGNIVALVLAMALGPYVVWPGWSRSYVGRLMRFGLPLAGASLLALGVVQIDNIVVGHTLGADALGLYLLAFSVSSWPVRAVSEAARRVSFAGFSRLADRPDALAQGFYRSSSLLTVAVVPLCVLLMVLAEPLITCVYGQNWVGAVTALRLLALLGMLRVLFELAYDCLAAMGRSRALMTVQGVWLALLIPALLIGANKGGINGVGAAHVLVAGCVVIPAFLVALAPGGVRAARLAAACVRPLVAGLVMAAACYGVMRVLGNGWATVIAGGIGGFAVYLPLVWPEVRRIRSGGGGEPEAAEAEPVAAGGRS